MVALLAYVVVINNVSILLTIFKTCLRCDELIIDYRVFLCAKEVFGIAGLVEESCVENQIFGNISESYTRAFEEALLIVL